MAWGAIGNVDAVMHEWSEIVRARGVIELGAGDWFFLPNNVWDAAKFWKMLLRVVPRISNLGLFSPTSEIQGPPELLDCPLRAIPWIQIRRHAIEFHLARTCGDEGVLRRLCKKFPRWRDPDVALRYLQRFNRPPTRSELFL